MAKDNINQDMALDDATDLAFDIDVHLREHSSTYNSEHTEVMEAQENIADDIISGNFDNVKGLLTRYATQNEDFFKRLDEYRENFLQDTGPFSVLIYNKETQAEQWLLLPAKPERFEKLLNDIGLSKDASPEQYAVSSYVISYGDLADYIATGENVDELNYLAYLLKNLNSEEMKIFLSAMEDEADIHSIENLINLAQNTDCYTLVDNMYDWDDYGKYVMEENGIDLRLLYDIEDYINFEQYGKDKAEERKAIMVDSAVLEKEQGPYTTYYDGNTAQIPDFCRITPIENDDSFIDDKIKRSMELANSLDRFFVAHDMDYAAKYPDGAMAMKLSESLYNGRTDNIKDMLTELGQTDDDVLPLELKEYEEKYIPVKYFIYQLKSGDDTRDFRFESLERLHSKGEFADKNNYDLIYSAAYMPSDTLEKLFQRFNIDIPQDFKGHSLSVSDIVVISGKGEEKAYYCDSVGFKEVPEFLDYIRIRSAVISNYEGYTALVGTDDKVYLGANENYHYMFDAPSYYDNSDKSVIHISDNHKMYSFLYGDGWVVSQQQMLENGAFTTENYAEFAELKTGVLSRLKCKKEITFAGEPFNYLANAEKHTEQNFNQIDGLINNEPPKPSIREQIKNSAKEHGEKKEPSKAPHKSEPEL